MPQGPQNTGPQQRAQEALVVLEDANASDADKLLELDHINSDSTVLDALQNELEAKQEAERQAILDNLRDLVTRSNRTQLDALIVQLETAPAPQAPTQQQTSSQNPSQTPNQSPQAPQQGPQQPNASQQTPPTKEEEKSFWESTKETYGNITEGVTDAILPMFSKEKHEKMTKEERRKWGNKAILISVGSAALLAWIFKGSKKGKEAAEQTKGGKLKKILVGAGVGLLALLGLDMYFKYKNAKDKLKELARLEGRVDDLERDEESKENPGAPYGLIEEEYEKAEESFKVWDVKALHEIFGLADGEESPGYKRFMEDMKKKYEIEVFEGLPYRKVEAAFDIYEDSMKTVMESIRAWVEDYGAETTLAAIIAWKSGLLGILGKTGMGIGKKSADVAKFLAKTAKNHPLVALLTLGGAIVGARALLRKGGEEGYMPAHVHALVEALQNGKPLDYPSGHLSIPPESVESMRASAMQIKEMGSSIPEWAVGQLETIAPPIAEGLVESIAMSKEERIAIEHSELLTDLKLYLTEKRDSFIGSEKAGPFTASINILLEYEQLFLARFAEGISDEEKQNLQEALMQKFKELQKAMQHEEVDIRIEIENGMVKWYNKEKDAMRGLSVDPSIQDLDTVEEKASLLSHGESLRTAAAVAFLRELMETQSNNIEQFGPWWGIPLGNYVYVFHESGDTLEYFLAPIDLMFPGGLDGEREDWHAWSVEFGEGAAIATVVSLNIALIEGTIRKAAIGGGTIKNWKKWPVRALRINPITSPVTHISRMKRMWIDGKVWMNVVGNMPSEKTPNIFEKLSTGKAVNRDLLKAGVRPEWIRAVEDPTTELGKLQSIARKLGVRKTRGLYAIVADTSKLVADKLRISKLFGLETGRKASASKELLVPALREKILEKLKHFSEGARDVDRLDAEKIYYAVNRTLSKEPVSNFNEWNKVRTIDRAKITLGRNVRSVPLTTAQEKAILEAVNHTEIDTQLGQLKRYFNVEQCELLAKKGILGDATKEVALKDLDTFKTKFNAATTLELPQTPTAGAAAAEVVDGPPRPPSLDEPEIKPSNAASVADDVVDAKNAETAVARLAESAPDEVKSFVAELDEATNISDQGRRAKRLSELAQDARLARAAEFSGDAAALQKAIKVARGSSFAKAGRIAVPVLIDAVFIYLNEQRIAAAEELGDVSTAEILRSKRKSLYLAGVGGTLAFAGVEWGFAPAAGPAVIPLVAGTIYSDYLYEHAIELNKAPEEYKKMTPDELLREQIRLSDTWEFADPAMAGSSVSGEDTRRNRREALLNAYFIRNSVAPLTREDETRALQWFEQIPEKAREDRIQKSGSTEAVLQEKMMEIAAEKSSSSAIRKMRYLEHRIGDVFEDQTTEDLRRADLYDEVFRLRMERNGEDIVYQGESGQEKRVQLSAIPQDFNTPKHWNQVETVITQYEEYTAVQARLLYNAEVLVDHEQATSRAKEMLNYRMKHVMLMAEARFTQGISEEKKNVVRTALNRRLEKFYVPYMQLLLNHEVSIDQIQGYLIEWEELFELEAKQIYKEVSHLQIAGEWKMPENIGRGLDEHQQEIIMLNGVNTVRLAAGLSDLGEGASEEFMRKEMTKATMDLMQQRAASESGRSFSFEGPDQRLAARLYPDAAHRPLVFSSLDIRERHGRQTPQNVYDDLTALQALVKNPSSNEEGFGADKVVAVFFELKELEGSTVALATFVYGDPETFDSPEPRLYTLQRASATSATRDIKSRLQGMSLVSPAEQFLTQKGSSEMIAMVKPALSQVQIKREAQEKEIQEKIEQREREKPERIKKQEADRSAAIKQAEESDTLVLIPAVEADGETKEKPAEYRFGAGNLTLNGESGLTIAVSREHSASGHVQQNRGGGTKRWYEAWGKDYPVMVKVYKGDRFLQWYKIKTAKFLKTSDTVTYEGLSIMQKALVTPKKDAKESINTILNLFPFEYQEGGLFSGEHHYLEELRSDLLKLYPKENSYKQTIFLTELLSQLRSNGGKISEDAYDKVSTWFKEHKRMYQ